MHATPGASAAPQRGAAVVADAEAAGDALRRGAGAASVYVYVYVYACVYVCTYVYVYMYVYM